jgi:hypothetical protein
MVYDVGGGLACGLGLFQPNLAGAKACSQVPAFEG